MESFWNREDLLPPERNIPGLFHHPVADNVFCFSVSSWPLTGKVTEKRKTVKCFHEDCRPVAKRELGHPHPLKQMGMADNRLYEKSNYGLGKSLMAFSARVIS